MKNYEEMGFLIGSIVGAVLSGVCIYFTSSIASAAISLVCALIGGWIGKSIPPRINNFPFIGMVYIKKNQRK